jgi:hypothetical protein
MTERPRYVDVAIRYTPAEGTVITFTEWRLEPEDVWAAAERSSRETLLRYRKKKEPVPEVAPPLSPYWKEKEAERAARKPTTTVSWKESVRRLRERGERESFRYREKKKAERAARTARWMAVVAELDRPAPATIAKATRPRMATWKEISAAARADVLAYPEGFVGWWLTDHDYIVAMFALYSQCRFRLL